ncbi:MAG: nucleotide exchange factor GrpE [Acidobacteriota bacterium]|nr:nucleotide exchange factor GrpE [Acidobacteriota bacterium]
MSEDQGPEVETAAEAGEIDLDTDPSQELDSAMREALEAIEKSRKSGQAAAAEGEVVEPPAPANDEMEDWKTQARESRERALRALADLENYRKRVQRERRDEQRFRALEPLRDILAVVDNLERALGSAGSVEDLKEGVSMILKQLGNLLRDHGVERIEAVGRGFDPSLHEAVTREEHANVPAPTVVEELQAGYLLHDRLLRPAVVKVAMPPVGEQNLGNGGNGRNGEADA